MLSIVEAVGAVADLISLVGELLLNWRLLLCLLLAAAVAVPIVLLFPTHGYWVSMPVMLAGVGCGLYWQIQARDKTSGEPHGDRP